MVEFLVAAVFTPRPGGAFVKGVGEPQTALQVKGKVVGDVEPFPFKPVGHDGNPIFLVADDTAGVLRSAALAAVQASLGVEHESVGAIRSFAIDGKLAADGVVAQDAAGGDVGEEEGVTVPGGSFGDAPVGSGE